MTSWHRRSVVSLIVVGAALLTIAPLTAAPPPRGGGGANQNARGRGAGEFAESEVLVKFRSGTTAEHAQGIAKGLGAQKVKEFGRLRIHHLKLPKKLGVAEAIRRLRAHPSVQYAEPNYFLYLDGIPDDPRFGELWGLHNTGQSGGTPEADVDAPAAWDVSTGDGTVVVGVLDTGIDYAHEDLAANVWTNPGEVAGNGLDDDGNGFIDDVHGWDFASEDNDPLDSQTHGTHVSGTIGAVANNATGVAGVCPNVRIMALKIFGGSVASTDAAIGALDYATMMRGRGVNIRLTSNSWGGGDFSQALKDAIQASGDAGLLFVASAGNSNRDNDAVPHYPSSYDCSNIIAVAATDHDDAKFSFSSYGATSVDLGAPGVSTLSTLPGDDYGLKSGTSMAAPHVSGVAALLFTLHPTASHLAIRTALLQGVDPVSSMSGITATGGRLNAYGAIGRVAMIVRRSVPAMEGTVSAPPTQFEIEFSYAPVAAPSAGALKVNGVSADGIQIVNATTYRFHFGTSPVTAEGLQTMTIPAGAVWTANPSVPPAHQSLKAWTASFRFDVTRLAVADAYPAEGGSLTVPGDLILTFNEAFDPTTLGPEDLHLDQGTVTAAVALDSLRALFSVSDLDEEGTVEYRLHHGALADVHGNPMLSYTGHLSIDFAVRDFPGALDAHQPLGSLIHEGSASANIAEIGDLDGFDLDVDGGQTVTLVVDPDETLVATVSLGASSASSPAAGEPAILQTVPVSAGISRITVEGSGTTGSYTLRVLLNVAVEASGTDQDIDPTFLTLAVGARRGAVRGDLDPTRGRAVFSAGFESGSLGSEWTTWSSLTEGRIRITDEHGASSGDRALWMDRDPSGDYNLNEAILTLDLTGLTQPVLGFAHATWYDETHDLAGDFADHQDGDGVAIRDAVAGGDWHPVVTLRNQSGGVWEEYGVDLVEAAQEHGIALSSSFQIKLQQYDNYPLRPDGRGWDDVAIHVPDGSPDVDRYTFTLAAGEVVALALHAADDDVELQLLDSADTVVATGEASLGSATLHVERYVAPEAGTYIARVTGNGFYSPSDLEYSLVVTVGAAFDLGQNNVPFPWKGNPTQQLVLTNGKALALGFAPSQPETLSEARVLYARDYGHGDPYLDAMNRLGITPTPSGLNPFPDRLNEGGWDLAIFIRQNWVVTGWTESLIDWVGRGGKAILTDCWVQNQEVAAAFGGSYERHKNKRSIIQRPHPIWEGISNPMRLENAGWSIFSACMTPTTGRSIGDYPNGYAAIIEANSGRTLLNGFKDDAPTPYEDQVRIAENSIRYLLERRPDYYVITLPAGAGNLVITTSTPADGSGEFVNQLDPEIRLHDASGTLLGTDDDSAPDGRNARLTHAVSAAAGRTVYVGLLVSDDAQGAAASGTYLLSVEFGPPTPVPGVTVSPTSGLETTEGGGQDTFTVVLDTQPTSDVTISLSSSDATEGTVSPTSLTFTASNWDSPRTVTVTGVDDDVLDGDVAYTIVTERAASSDPAYDSLAVDDVSVTNQDDETPVTTTYASTDVPKAIPDQGTVTSTLAVSDTDSILDLDVRVDITHSRDGDLDVTLVAPDGTRVELFTDVGDNGDDFTGTVLDDEASTSVTAGNAPFTGTWRPEGSLSDLDGKGVNGTWKLEVTDDKKKQQGTLVSWSITVQRSGS